MGDEKSAREGGKPPIWKNIGIRFVTAVAFVAICTAPFYFGGWVWGALVALIGSFMMFEWVRMSDPDAPRIAYIIPIIGFLIAIIYAVQGLALYSFIALLVTLCAAVAERARRVGAAKSKLNWTVLGVIYVLGASLLIIGLRGNEAGFDTVGFQRLFFIILVVVGADVGAYLGGSYFKGPKMSPKLSPNKTWSGAASGLALALKLAFVYSLVIGQDPVMGLIFAVLLVGLSVLGDLFESGVKRRLDVKDSGDLLPGHGGFLDSLDSLMAAVAGACLILTLFPQIWSA